jgi:hypothetical protein
VNQHVRTFVFVDVTNWLLMEDQTFLYKEKCIEALQSSFVTDLPTVNVVEIDSGMGLYEGFQVRHFRRLLVILLYVLRS